MNLTELKEKPIDDLNEIAKELKIEGASNLRKQELIFAILQAQSEKNGTIYGEGVLETLQDGFGFSGADYNPAWSRRHLYLPHQSAVQPAHR
jgi:transcription termination factor Rho